MPAIRLPRSRNMPAMAARFRQRRQGLGPPKRTTV